MKSTAASLLFGLACFALAMGLAGLRASEELVWGAWLVTTGGAAYFAGRMWHGTPWRCGFVIAATQPIGFYCYSWFSGWHENPGGSSTGGMVGVMIVMTLLIAWSPIPVLLSGVGGTVRRRSRIGPLTPPGFDE